MLRHFVNPLPPAGNIPLKLDPPLNRCIYCTETEGLTKEHIIQESLGGKLYIPGGSCPKHRDDTSAAEGHVVSQLFRHAKAQFGIKSKKKHGKPPTTHLEILETFSPSVETAPRKMVPLADHPSMLLLPYLEPPKIVGGGIFIPMEDNFAFPVEMWQLTPVSTGKIYMEFRVDSFIKVLAKIGHAACVAAVGIDGFQPSLISIIEGNIDGYQQFVGSTPNDVSLLPFEYPEGLHQVAVDILERNGSRYVAAEIRLFSHLFRNPPERLPWSRLTQSYLIVAGLAA